MTPELKRGCPKLAAGTDATPDQNQRHAGLKPLAVPSRVRLHLQNKAVAQRKPASASKDEAAAADSDVHVTHAIAQMLGDIECERLDKRNASKCETSGVPFLDAVLMLQLLYAGRSSAGV